MALNYIGSEVEVSVLPGFRFHPTDEELISFYLLRKLQNRALPGDVIKYLNLYHYDPWDLPCMAAVQGQNEWYFYSPRDKKYPNSARPNRATRSGFWKATGTDKFVYTSDGSTRIGVKKSLVFYRGRATKGTKTEWTMQEFRLSASRCSSTSVNAKECESLAIYRVSKQSRFVATSINRVKKAISIPKPRLLAAAASNKELAGQLSAIRDVLHACDEKKQELGSNKVIEWTKSGNELWTCATSSNHKELWLQEIEELSAGDQQGSWMNVKPTKTILWEAMQTYEDLSSSFNMHWPTNNLHELQQMEMVWNTQTILESPTSSSMHSSDILLSNQTPSSFTYTQPLPPISPASWPPS